MRFHRRWRWLTFAGVAIALGGRLLERLEDVREITLVAKTGIQGDRGDRHLGLHEQFAGALDARFAQQLGEGAPGAFLEQAGERPRRDAHLAGDPFAVERAARTGTNDFERLANGLDRK